MAAPVLTIQDASQVLPARGAVNLDITIKRNGVAMNLAAKTVTATIRKESAPGTIINASLEDISMTVTDAPNGVARVALTNAMMILLSGGPRVTDVIPYIVTCFVVEDNYQPQPGRIYINRSLT